MNLIMSGAIGIATFYVQAGLSTRVYVICMLMERIIITRLLEVSDH